MPLSLVQTSRREALKRFLEEDIGQGDVTTLAIVPPDQKAIDRDARLTISGELGHGREAVVSIYIGR